MPVLRDVRFPIRSNNLNRLHELETEAAKVPQGLIRSALVSDLAGRYSQSEWEEIVKEAIHTARSVQFPKAQK